MEAARAGRHGKGFAVVADEVRALAGRSASLPRKAPRRSRPPASASNGFGAAAAVTESLEEITKAIAETASLVAEIADETKKQAAAQEQVKSGLTRIEGVTQSNAAQAEQTAASAAMLAQSASVISELVAAFKRPEQNTSNIASVASDPAIETSMDSSWERARQKSITPALFRQ